MIDTQNLAKSAPYFGAPNVLHRQNQHLALLFSQHMPLPLNATRTLNRFWRLYDSAPQQLMDELTRVEIAHLTWCLALEQDGRKILDDLEATDAMLTVIQRKYRRSYLYGLRYSFFCGYHPTHPAFGLLTSALRQMLAKLDLTSPNNQQWKLLAEILSARAELVLARKIIADDIPYPAISQQLHLPEDSRLYRHTCNALVDVIISERLVKRRTKTLLDFLEGLGDLNMIKHAVERLLFYYHNTSREPTESARALINFARKHLGDIRMGNGLYWLGVDKRAQDVFARWLSIIELQTFFDEIAPDSERKAFWLEYLDSIEFSRVVVGREKAEQLSERGRYAELITGKTKRNALILKIGDLVVVEFAGAENLRYVYREQSLPFALNARSYYMAELCHPNALFKQYLEKGWQANLAGTLHNHFGIYRHQSRRDSMAQRRHQRLRWGGPVEANMRHAVALS